MLVRTGAGSRRALSARVDRELFFLFSSKPSRKPGSSEERPWALHPPRPPSCGPLPRGDVVVVTPERLWALVNDRLLSLQHVRSVVVDEARPPPARALTHWTAGCQTGNCIRNTPHTLFCLFMYSFFSTLTFFSLGYNVPMLPCYRRPAPLIMNCTNATEPISFLGAPA